jgi:hypothetical protein
MRKRNPSKQTIEILSKLEVITRYHISVQKTEIAESQF